MSVSSTLPHLFLASDHAGFQLKKSIFEFLKLQFPSYSVTDCGTNSEEPSDYPDIARVVCERVTQDYSLGIFICGSGIGASISANKFKGIRAALCFNSTMARFAKAHTNANILCLGSRIIGQEVAFDCVKAWLVTPFEGERHLRRVEKIEAIEEE